MKVAWQTEDRPGGKPTKVPYAPDGRKAMADKPRTWGSRAEAQARAARLARPYGDGGVGFELGDLGDGRRGRQIFFWIRFELGAASGAAEEELPVLVVRAIRARCAGEGGDIRAAIEQATLRNPHDLGAERY